MSTPTDSGRLGRGWLSNLRAEERPYTAAAFATLLAITAAHVLLETARDALFLARVPAARLPFVYLGITALALLISQFQARRTVEHGECKTLGGWMLFAGGVTVLFWLLLPSTQAWIFYALYIWSGVVITLLVVHYWTLLNDHYTPSQARRLYSLIGLGSIMGAVAGTGLASVLTTLLPAHHLVLAAALILLTSAFVSVPRLHFECELERSKAPGRPAGSLLGTLRQVTQHPYAGRVALLILLTTLATTIGDYVFKAEVAARVPKADLGRFFALLYLCLNIASFLVQLSLVRWLLRRFTVATVLMVLPVLLLLGGAGVAALGGLAAAVLIKGADGSLKHSLQRTATELLYVPMSDHLRARVKSIIDLLCQRGGQAVASLGILGAVSLGAGPEHLGLVLAGLAGAWLVVLAGLHRHYVDNFRRALESQRSRFEIDYPELDAASLATLLESLNSDDDARVLAALSVIRDEGRGDQLPRLLLHHPAPTVVEATLDTMLDSGRTDIVPVIDRRLQTAPAALRPALVRARARVAPDRAWLEARLEDPHAESRTTAAVFLLARGERDLQESMPIFDRILGDGSEEARVALADALALELPEGGEPLLQRLSEDLSLRVRCQALRAMARQPRPAWIPRLIELLDFRPARQEARAALAAIGTPALAPIAEALVDDARPRSVRWQLPEALVAMAMTSAADAKARVEADTIAELLTRHLHECPDGMQRYRCLVHVERLQMRVPGLRLDRGVHRERLLAALDRYLSTGLGVLAACYVVSRGADADEARRTPVHALLVRVLKDKERHARDNVLRLLGLLHRIEEIPRIRESLRRGDRNARSSAMELLTALLADRLDEQKRARVLALCDDGPARERLAAAREAPAGDYLDVLRVLLDSPSETLRSLAAHHVGELRLSELRPELEATAPDAAGMWRQAVTEALAALDAEAMRGAAS